MHINGTQIHLHLHVGRGNVGAMKTQSLNGQWVAKSSSRGVVDAELSDNFFHMRPGLSRTVVVRPATSLSERQVNQKLKVRSLVNTYKESDAES